MEHSIPCIWISTEGGNTRRLEKGLTVATLGHFRGEHGFEVVGPGGEDDPVGRDARPVHHEHHITEFLLTS